jgi:PAS domain S-box-containing protein
VYSAAAVMNFFKSPRNRNQSKRFPTREAEEKPKPPREVISSTAKLSKAMPREESHVVIPTRNSRSNTENTDSSNSKEYHRRDPVSRPTTDITTPPIAGSQGYQHQYQPHTEESSMSSSQRTERNTPRLKVRESIKEEPDEENTPGQPQVASDSDFDLRPAPVKEKGLSLEDLADLLYSKGYLEYLTSDPQLLGRFSVFLNKYRPDIAPLIQQYLETQKVIKATAYANAVASTLIAGNSSRGKVASPAVELTSSFMVSSRRAFNTLLEEALPAWVTYSLVKTATACLRAEITNRSIPLTRELLGGLSEVFCISDPNQQDNPLIYASDEFYRLTGYSRDYVLGRNCRFLQGPKTRRECPRRLRTSIEAGEELCETILNYRRDGTPFVNVLLLAPLHDSRGRLKYFLGAQVDATRLVEDGRGVDGFEKYLRRREFDSKQFNLETKEPHQNVLDKLRDLGKTFDLEESAAVEDSSHAGASASGSKLDIDASRSSYGMTRNIIQEEDDLTSSDEEDGYEDMDMDEKAWTFSGSTTSGRLPGIYQKYVLIRAYPSLKMVFVSHRAKKLGPLTQQPFLAHIAAPAATLAGVKSSLESGRPVTAKVAIMSRRGMDPNGTMTGRWSKKTTRLEGEINPSRIGKTCWISATPLLDSERKIGVWIVVIVEKAGADTNMAQSLDNSRTASRQEFHVDTSRTTSRQGFNVESSTPLSSLGHVILSSGSDPSDMPIKPVRVGDLETPSVASPVPGTQSPVDTFGRVRGTADSKEEEDSFELAEATVQVIEKAPTISTIHSKYGESELSPTASRNSFQINDSMFDDERSTPRRSMQGDRVASTRSSMGNMDVKRDVGLRAMDNLSNRSPINRITNNEAFGGDGRRDSSPNSID